MHDTLKKFQYPDSLIKDYTHWSLLLRPRHLTIGCMVICAREDVRAFPDLSIEALAELKTVTTEAEGVLRHLFVPQKFNYICLMMVDPQFHLHLFPRYDAAQVFGGVTFEDTGWPKPPDISTAKELDRDLFDDLKMYIKRHIG